MTLSKQQPFGGVPCVPTSQLQLRVVKNPVAIWYKDVGGKRNVMTVELALDGNVPMGLQYRLRTSLYLESGKRVDDEWQWVLACDDTRLPLLGVRCRGVTIPFRLEKVSTAFMGQKFKVRVEALPTAPLGTAGLVPLEAFTTPIESKAKPRRSAGSKSTKRRSSTAVSYAPTRSKRRRRQSAAGKASQEQEEQLQEEALQKATRELQDAQERIKLTEAALQTVVGKLEKTVARVAALEERFSILRPPLLGDETQNAILARPPPLTRFTSDCSIGSTGFALNDAKIKREPLTTGMGEFSQHQLMPNLSRRASSAEEAGSRLKLERLTSLDLKGAFNWLPSAVAGGQGHIRGG